jgi:hypothetical protein
MSLRVAFSIDVEEEGLFSGRYDAVARGVANVAHLRRLEWVTREFGVPLTLLCTWPVFNDAAARDVLRHWREDLGAEIGLHLHPWNTPPLADAAGASSRAWTPSEEMPAAVLDAKLAELARICREATGAAGASFRMGRFDLGPRVRALLPGHGIRVDGSIVPCTWSPALPEAFLSPADPYPLETGAGPITEAPVTVTPFSPATRALAWRTGRPWLLRRFHALGAPGIIPSWYPLVSMKMAARLHLGRGGRVLHLFLHSSELMPGCAPHVPDAPAIARMVEKTRAFFHWLRRRAPFTGATLSDLALPQPAKDAP